MIYVKRAALKKEEAVQEWLNSYERALLQSYSDVRLVQFDLAPYILGYEIVATFQVGNSTGRHFEDNAE